MNYFYENSTPVLFVGFVLFAASVMMFIKSGRKLGLVLAIVICAITGLLAYLERSVVTETEEIQNKLVQIETDVEQNDHEKILAHFSQDAGVMRSSADTILRQFDVEKVTIKRNLKIRIIKEGEEAEAKFNAVAKLSEKNGPLKNKIIPRFFTVKFVKEAGLWKVRHYKHEDPRQGLKKED